MKVLVTGGSGFIGAELLPKLVELGHEVCSLERYVTGRYVLGARTDTVFGDLRDGFSIRKLVKDTQPEAVIHLAAISPVAYSYDHPQEVFEVNALGTINLAEACSREVPNFKHFLYAGTSEEYGNQDKFPVTENAELRPNSPYAVSKVAADKYLQYMRAAYDFPVTVLRPFNCYDEETEVLTKVGFKPFNKLKEDEWILSLNPETGCIEYQKPVDFIACYYEGPMIKVSGSQLDLLVTPNHNMWVRKRWNGGYEFMEARELVKYEGKRAIVFQLSAMWNGENTERFVPPNSNRSFGMGDWIKFIAWYLSEGHVDRRKGHHGSRIKQKKLENIEEISKIMRKLGLKPWKITTDGGYYQTGFSDEELNQYLKQFGKSREKFIPEYVKKLSRDSIREFLNIYQKGDGHIGYYNGYKACEGIRSYSQRMIDDLQELCLKAGWASSNKKGFLTIAKRRTEVCPRTENNFTLVDYSGMIYCVTVPNHVIFVRRHGKGVFCGNTYGRKDNTHFVVERTITQMLQGKTVRLGDPTPARDFIYVDDHVDAYLTCLNNPKAKGGVFNFCTGRDITIKELIELISKLTGFKGKIQWNTIPARPLDIKKLLGSYEKAKKVLGWRPKYTLEEGLKKTIEFWESKLKGGET